MKNPDCETCVHFELCDILEIKALEDKPRPRSCRFFELSIPDAEKATGGSLDTPPIKN